jgi:menaquinone-specific isochorismate synthase
VSGPLVARTTAGDPTDGDGPIDRADAAVVAFSSPRRAMWGTGEALRIDLPAPWPDHVDRVARALAAIRVEGTGPVGAGAVAFGALPYDRSAPASLVVPAVVHGRSSDGDRWTTTIGDGDHPAAPGAVDAPVDGAAPTTVSVHSVRPPEEWMAAVAVATKRIVDGELTKVVLARELVATADRPFRPARLHPRFRDAAPHALCFCVDGHVGATPELLVSRVGDVVRAHPMAGTLPRTGDPEADQRRAGELLGSHKNRVEHQITIDMVHDTLLPWCSYLDAEPEPSVVAAGPVQHLATLVEGRLSQPAPSVLELVAALHPTPAVGGWPRPEALALQAELEGADRGCYAGPVGWVDAGGNGAWGVGIRGVQVSGTTARLFAGVGVVADSDPAAELEETRAKAQAVLGPLLRL